MSKGTDWSNFQPIPMQADVDALRAAGQADFAIVGLQDPDHGEAQAVVLRALGIPVEDCYVENMPNPRIPAGVVRGWVAVEDGSGFTTQADVDVQLAYLTAQGLQAGVYSSRTMLAKYAINVTCPLWLADYDDTPAPLAGAAIKQYSGDGQIPGLAYTLDLDYRDDAPQEDEDSMADRQLAEGSQDIAILNDVAAKALGPLAAGDQSQGVSAYVRRGPSVDLPATEEELIIRVPAGTIPALSS